MRIKRLLYFATAILVFAFASGLSAETESVFDRIDKALLARDYKTAIKIMTPLAEKGDAKVQLKLGQMYIYGLGVDKDYTEAVKWIRSSADQGFADAEYHLGVLYYRGQGVEKNYDEMIRWYRKSANQGYLNAQHSLGMMYYLGWGVPKDFVRAYKWLSLAGSKGYKMALQTKTKLDGIMTPAQIAEAETLANQWREKK